MKVALLLMLFISVLLAAGQPLYAEEAGQPPLQLAPGTGVQQGTPHPLVQPGQGLTPSLGEQPQLHDIHGPLPLPEERNYALLVVGLFLLLLVLAVAFWFFRLRKKKIILPYAHDTALAALLQARSLMNPDQALLYAAELSDILRHYIEARFRIHSTRQTTQEFLSCLSQNPGHRAALLEEYSDSLQECLGQCDMAKFARCTPDRNSMEKMEKAVENFIESTREIGKGGR
ncbi:MAG: DUF4381 family protein [Proteobacteria bacterium]|nr:DUF4381 family protein [Pseudomonadota bacterium]MBU1057653.1 DUF4381 family protein [Pseudomonadota bacterium]